MGCAAETANKFSIAGVLGLDSEAHPFLGALLGHTFSGLYDAAGHVGSIIAGPDRLAAVARTTGDVVTGGVVAGLPAAEKLGILGGGLAGAVQDATVNAVAQSAGTVTPAGVTQAAGWTAAKVFGFGKLALDGGIFLGSIIACAGGH